MKTIKALALIIAATFVAIQFVPVKRDNPAGPDTFNAPRAVWKIIERSCYDCHSNKTRWPWYAYVAPVSWTISNDVRRARKKLNFSNWDTLSAEKQKSKIGKIREEIEEGDMPLPKYLKIHRDARLTKLEKQTIYNWARSAGASEDE